MVIWSYLLVGASAPASVENVLAPVEGPYAASVPTAGDEAAAYSAESAVNRDANPARPLVQIGADELDLLASLEQLLTERFQPAGRLRLIPQSALPSLDAGAVLSDIELVDAPSRLNAGTMLLRYRLSHVEGGSEIKVLSFRAEVLADVWFTQRRVSPGELLASVELTTREVNVLREPKSVPADPSLINRYEVARTLAAERPLTWNDITPRALVRKGEFVEVVASEGMLSISMKGQAVRNGALGEVISIRNLESRREFPAEVIDENKVRVHF